MRHSYLLPSLQEIAYSLSSLNVTLPMGFFVGATRLRTFLLIPILV